MGAVVDAIPDWDATAQVAFAVLVGLGALAFLYFRFILPVVDKDRREGRGPSAGAMLKESIDNLHASTSRLESIMQEMGRDMGQQSGHFEDNLELFRAMLPEVRAMNKSLDSMNAKLEELVKETVRKK